MGARRLWPKPCDSAQTGCCRKKGCIASREPDHRKKSPPPSRVRCQKSSPMKRRKRLRPASRCSRLTSCEPCYTTSRICPRKIEFETGESPVPQHQMSQTAVQNILVIGDHDREVAGALVQAAPAAQVTPVATYF